jgi:hypothetical protein
MTCGCGKPATHWVQVNHPGTPIQYQEMCLNCTGEYIGAEPVQVINIKDLEAKQRNERQSEVA